MRKSFFILFTLLTIHTALAAPKYEMRAVWITTNWGLDWPSRPARTPREIAVQQAELDKILDHVASLNFNTVFFQVRTKGEVFYYSYIEPWSPIVSGESGVSPGYDPLAYVIEACHERGLECHAWMVTIPAGGDKQVSRQGEQSLPARHPELCVHLKDEWFLDPGNPKTARYLASIAEEVAGDYPVDGIHIDYIRYPGEKGTFPDDNSYAQYAAKDMTRRQWQAHNITHIVRTISRAVKSIDESIMISSAPLGRYTALPQLSYTDWTCTGSAKQDPIQWMKEGYNDFVAPMMYYKGNDFTPYLIDWVQRIENHAYIVAGIGIYRLDAQEGGWELADIQQQIEDTRTYGAAGQALFRYKHLCDYPQLAQTLATQYYQHPALIPPMHHVDTPQIQPVTNLKITDGTLTWQHSKGAVRYVIYASATQQLDINDPQYIIETWETDNTYTIDTTQYRTIAVTAIDAFRRETAPTYIIIH